MFPFDYNHQDIDYIRYEKLRMKEQKEELTKIEKTELDTLDNIRDCEYGSYRLYKAHEYLNAPLKYGIFYNVPYALEINEWDVWRSEIKKRHPIQYFFRDWIFSCDNPVYFFLFCIKEKIRDIKYIIKYTISPSHPRFHKAYPRAYHKDLCQVILDVNFAMILDFWYEEIVDGHVDWDSDEPHSDFYSWIKESVKYIEVERPKMLDDMENLLSDACDNTENIPYKEKYSKYHAVQNSITDRDNAILTYMIEKRDYFWT